ncbi:MAG: putative PEP-binding protein [Ferrimicrobium sp.]
MDPEGTASAETEDARAAPPDERVWEGFGIGTDTVVGRVRHRQGSATLPEDHEAARSIQGEVRGRGAGAQAHEFPSREELRHHLEAELTKAAGELEGLAEGAPPQVGAILEAQAMMAQDPTLVDRLLAPLLSTEQADRPSDMASISIDRRALQAAFETVAAELRTVGGYIGERADDITEIGTRVGDQLFGRAEYSWRFDDDSILVLEQLSAAEAAKLDPTALRGVIVATGGPTGHAALILRSLDIAAVVGCRGASELPEGSMVLLNPLTGQVSLTSATSGHLGRVTEGFTPRRDRRRSHRSVLATGAVHLLANVGSPEDAVEAHGRGADGIGLVRTEFLFEGQAEEPSVDQQVDVYRSILDPFAHSQKPVIFRTLDAGSDKPLPFITLAREDNPALGVRGFRLVAQAPGVLERQLEALAQAQELVPGVEMRVMAPMVSSPAEVRSFVGMARSAGLGTVGVMIEVPALALGFVRVAPLVDFASIGTNDLLQYLMGADRNGPALGALLDPWNPVALGLIESVARAGTRAQVGISVCGEAASDPLLAIVLAGLGVSSLSMTPVALAGVRAVLDGLSMTRARVLARRALSQEDASRARRTIVDAQ